MALYRPTNTDKIIGERKTATIWSFEVVFAGRRYGEYMKTTRKTFAAACEKRRHLELERFYDEGTRPSGSHRVSARCGGIGNGKKHGPPSGHGAPVCGQKYAKCASGTFQDHPEFPTYGSHAPRAGRQAVWLDDQLARIFAELDSVLHEVTGSGFLTPRFSDEVLSFGERISSLMVTAALRQLGLDAVHLDARQAIVTDARHSHASPLFHRNERFAPPQGVP
jgi:hypothetical protein